LTSGNHRIAVAHPRLSLLYDRTGIREADVPSPRRPRPPLAGKGGGACFDARLRVCQAAGEGGSAPGGRPHRSGVPSPLAGGRPGACLRDMAERNGE